MGSNIKQTIMDTARRLFSERGFQNTSMRDIAAALQISVGNLTYHYKKKEDLIETILAEDHQKYQKPVPFITLDGFAQMLSKMAAQKENRPYYFKHYTQLAQISPAIYEMQISVMEDLNYALIKSFENFTNNGILKKEYVQEYPKIVSAIMTLMIYELPDFRQMQVQEKRSYWLDCVWSIIIPCLTERGQMEYQLLSEQKPKKSSAAE